MPLPIAARRSRFGKVHGLCFRAGAVLCQRVWRLDVDRVHGCRQAFTLAAVSRWWFSGWIVSARRFFNQGSQENRGGPCSSVARACCYSSGGLATFAAALKSSHRLTILQKSSAVIIASYFAECACSESQGSPAAFTARASTVWP